MKRSASSRYRLVGALAAAVLVAELCTGAAAGAATTGSNSAPNTPAPKPLPTKTSLTIAVSAPIENFAAPEIALVEGEFAKENLDVKVTVVPQTNITQLVTQQAAPIAIGGYSAADLNAINGGIPLVYIGDPFGYTKNNPTGLYVASKLLTSKGLLKKTVNRTLRISLGRAGVTSPAFLNVQKWFKKNGLTYHQAQTVPLATGTMLVAMKTGSIDGGFENPPYTSELVGNPQFKLVTAPQFAAGSVETSQAYLKAHKPIVEAVMRAIMRTDRTYLAPGYRNNASVMNDLSSWLKIPVATIKKSPPLVFSPTLSLKPVLGSFAGLQNAWLKYGGVLQYTKPLPMSQIATTSVVNSVLAGK